ncbi:hypothetical protein EP7_004018 [Isosphaeraceae bacterium EP7]
MDPIDDEGRAGQISSAIWLLGMAALFYTGRWWPGIMFVIGASSIVQCLLQGRGWWYAMEASIWSIGIGLWALTGYSMAAFFGMLGVAALFGALFRPSPHAKPEVDNRLE